MSAEPKYEPGSPAWLKRRAELLERESHGPLRWWWLSFADDDKGGFLGAAIVQARGFTSAVQQAHLLHINPGGQVAGWEIAPESDALTERFRNRLLTREEAESIGQGAKTSQR